MKRALITGITGQDGSYLAELLIAQGFEVHGIVRREAIENPAYKFRNISHLLNDINLHIGSVDNHLTFYKIVSSVKPDHFYHLASLSFVSHDLESDSMIELKDLHTTHYILSSLRELAPDCRFYFAGSSEMFGAPDETPQSESTRFNPRSIYGISKVAAFYLVKNYRRKHRMFASCGILYNHESPRRGFEFVTRKITSTVAKIHLGLCDVLELGDLEARRDWGYAPEYVEAMFRILSHNEPDDFVIATGKLNTVRDFLAAAFSVVNLDYRDYVKINENFIRSDNSLPLCGINSKAKSLLNWNPVKAIGEIAFEMVQNDISIVRGNK